MITVYDTCLTVSIPRRTALFDNSFVPSAIQQWNSLPCHLHLTQCPSLAWARIRLRSKFPSRTVPLHVCLDIAYFLLYMHESAITVITWIALFCKPFIMLFIYWRNKSKSKLIFAYIVMFRKMLIINVFIVPSLLTNAYKCFTALAISIP